MLLCYLCQNEIFSSFISNCFSLWTWWLSTIYFLLFFSLQDAEFDDQLHSLARFGPQIIYSESFYGIRSRSGVELIKTSLNVIEMIVVIIATYYLLDLTYPAGYCQMLGVLQEVLMNEPFEFLSRKSRQLVRNLQN